MIDHLLVLLTTKTKLTDRVTQLTHRGYNNNTIGTLMDERFVLLYVCRAVLVYLYQSRPAILGARSPTPCWEQGVEELGGGQFVRLANRAMEIQIRAIFDR